VNRVGDIKKKEPGKTSVSGVTGSIGRDSRKMKLEFGAITQKRDGKSGGKREGQCANQLSPKSMGAESSSLKSLPKSESNEAESMSVKDVSLVLEEVGPVSLRLY